MSCTFPTRRSGFTLIELVTVIVLLAILAAVAGAPTLASMALIRSRAASARIAADLRYAQRMALASGLRTWVLFNTASQQYQLYIEDSNNLGKANRQTLTRPYDQSSGPVSLNAGPFVGVTLVSVTIGGTAEVEFDNFGVPYNGAGVALSANGSINLSDGTSVAIHAVSGMAERAG